MQEHLTRLKAAGQTVVALTERAAQAPDQTALDAALYELVDAVQDLNSAYAALPGWPWEPSRKSL